MDEQQDPTPERHRTRIRKQWKSVKPALSAFVAEAIKLAGKLDRATKEIRRLRRRLDDANARETALEIQLHEESERLARATARLRDTARAEVA